ncbi:MAG: tRNA pseudouridine synthase A [Planctomycetota bacterium]|nr:MAG: tRNA pseudouridine synthase A [Planctomycetota bacterium]
MSPTAPRQRLALDLTLDGTGYAGTAIQPAHTPTLHRHLSGILDHLDQGSGTSLACCSRLDAGVAAEHFPVHCDISSTWDPLRLVLAINGQLISPQKLRHAVVLRWARVDPDWDSRRSAHSKTYRYSILIRRAPLLSSQHGYWLRHMPNIDSLQACAKALLGSHDLAGFACLRGDASDAYHPTRAITHSSWNHSPAPGGGHWLHYTVTGEGFLYKQVRGMVGAMLACANTRSTANINTFTQVIYSGRSATRLGEVAPARGLCLLNVDYGARTPRWHDLQ